jgi:hypothetical protein
MLSPGSAPRDKGSVYPSNQKLGQSPRRNCGTASYPGARIVVRAAKRHARAAFHAGPSSFLFSQVQFAQLELGCPKCEVLTFHTQSQSAESASTPVNPRPKETCKISLASTTVDL